MYSSIEVNQFLQESIQLTYRGVKYVCDRKASLTENCNSSAIATTPNQAIGKYRGAVLREQNHPICTAPKSSFDLKYRGIIYQSVTGA
jgi:hypothetical protein